jgi:initiation factor 1A
MPKNTKGGKGFKKRKTKAPMGPGPIQYPDDEQLYGVVTKRLGNGWVSLTVCDKLGSNVRDVLGRIRGQLRKRRVRFYEGNYVIACGRLFEHASVEKPKVDILHKYCDEHVRILTNSNKIPVELRRKLDEISGSAAAAVASGGIVHAKKEIEDDDVIFDNTDFEDADIDDM